MASGTKSFILNRKSDWQDNSIISNLTFDGENLVSEMDNSNSGIYISSSFDSLESETIWHRLRLDAKIPQNIKVKLRIYTSDSLTAYVPAFEKEGNAQVQLDEIFMDPNISAKEKLDLFDFLGAKQFENPDDLVLYEFKGRYLWFSLEVINYASESVVIEKVKIEFPRVSFIDYLPEVYQSDLDPDSFLARFLSIFQSLYVDLEDEIDNMPSMFDPMHVDPKFLNWIAEWFSIENGFYFSEDKLRILIKEAVDIYKMKGTKESISRMIEIYTGYKPIIVEQFDVTDNDFYNNAKEQIKRLFGNSIYTFSVIIRTDQEVTSDMYAGIMRIVNYVKPANTMCNLVILNNAIYLDHHCYLGVNSYTDGSEFIVLSDKGSGQNSVFLTDQENK